MSEHERKRESMLLSAAVYLKLDRTFPQIKRYLLIGVPYLKAFVATAARPFRQDKRFRAVCAHTRCICQSAS